MLASIDYPDTTLHLWDYRRRMSHLYVHRVEIPGDGFAILVGDVFEAVTDQMHHTRMDPGVGVDGFDRFG